MDILTLKKWEYMFWFRAEGYRRENGFRDARKSTYCQLN